MYLVHPEHPPSGLEALRFGNRLQALRWITFRAANGSLSERRAQAPLKSREQSRRYLTSHLNPNEHRFCSRVASVFPASTRKFIALIFRALR
jgi:hypothetical protein